LIVKERLVIFGENKIMGLNCVLLGAGNVASHLGPALKVAGYKILQVYSRTDSSARQLALKLEAVPLVRAGDVISDADFYFVALSDSAFAEVLPQIKIKNGFERRLRRFMSNLLPRKYMRRILPYFLPDSSIMTSQNR